MDWTHVFTSVISFYAKVLAVFFMYWAGKQLERPGEAVHGKLARYAQATGYAFMGSWLSFVFPFPDEPSHYVEEWAIRFLIALAAVVKGMNDALARKNRIDPL
jgi:hypothetical protein